ncbi:MAG: NADPH:quinone oxidoreductase family protein [SAR324 cluster bacterium]|nr:NADPH:quinone oxidoreductase family protein [SAR324 cluster bacterium]
MKAILCRSYGTAENLVFEEIDDLLPGEGELVIEVYSAAMNFPDTLQIAGKYQNKPKFPFSPGSEAGGIVKAVGPDVKGLAVGDRVLATPGIGCMAEQVLCRENQVKKIPDLMDFKTASGFTMVYGTSFHALKQRAALKAGETLLVIGASGGVGLSAVELGKVMGATVIAAASSEEKLLYAKNAGADFLVNYGDGEMKNKVKALTGGKGADVIYDPVGGDLFDQAVRCINWNGRLLVIGFTSGRIPQFPINLALLKSISIVGVFWGALRQKEPEIELANQEALFCLYAEGKLKPLVSQSFAFEDYVSAFNVLTERKAIGKVVLEIKSE